MTKKEKTQIGIVLCSVFLIIVSIIGNTYAYFVSTISGNETAKGTVVTTGSMKIVYENNDEISGDTLLPGWKSEVKTFTVKNEGTLPVTYDIQLTNITNTFGDKIDNVTGKPEELVFSLTGDNEITIEEKQFPAVDDAVARGITIEPNTTHTYTMQVTFKELGEAQDYNQGRSFSGKIEIAETALAKAIAFGTDNSGAAAPELDNGLIPVTWNGTTWVKADTSKAWYNYEKQAWANAVTVSTETRDTYTNAESETEIKMEDIETMWVWIPRYEYQHTNLSTQYAGGTKELPGGIEINFISKETITPSSENFTIHDAFWWDDNNDGNKDTTEQLSGIWVAKFEIYSDIECTIKNTSEETGCDITTIYPQIKPNVTSWRGARIGTFWTVIHNNMNGENNTYGLSNSDAHLMKNMEWGAVAYLSQSKYGKYGNPNYTGANKEIYQNKSEEYITGSSNGTPSQNEYNIQSTYDIEEKGTGASTTGNIYGIYDMSGGAAEYVMGIMKESTNTEPAIGSDRATKNHYVYRTGWSGKLYDGTDYTGTYGLLKEIGSKYYDLYDYGTSDSDYTRYHKGDATYETAGWYSDESKFIYSFTTFFYRGLSGASTTAGVFGFNTSGETNFSKRSGRPVLVQTN